MYIFNLLLFSFADKLGMSKYQQEQIGILVHVLYSNPRVLYAPNNTDADKIITKVRYYFLINNLVTSKLFIF